MEVYYTMSHTIAIHINYKHQLTVHFDFLYIDMLLYMYRRVCMHNIKIVTAIKDYLYLHTQLRILWCYSCSIQLADLLPEIVKISKSVQSCFGELCLLSYFNVNICMLNFNLLQLHAYICIQYLQIMHICISYCYSSLQQHAYINYHRPNSTCLMKPQLGYIVQLCIILLKYDQYQTHVKNAEIRLTQDALRNGHAALKM